MLKCVKVIQGALEIEASAAIFTEHKDKRRIPHKKAAIEGSVNKIGDKTGSGLGSA